MDVIEDYEQLCRLVATGDPITSDRLPTPDNKPRTGPVRTIGNGYEFRRTIEAQHEMGRELDQPPVPVEAACFAILRPEGGLYLANWAGWSNPHIRKSPVDISHVHQFQFYVAHTNVSLEVPVGLHIIGLTEASDLGDRDRSIEASRRNVRKRLAENSEAGQVMHTITTAMQFLKDPPASAHPRHLTRLRLRVGMTWVYCQDILEHLRATAPQLCLLHFEGAKPIEAGDFRQLLDWMGEQPETAGRVPA